MKKKLPLVLLVDDDHDCNFFHERLLKKSGVVDKIQVASDGMDALSYLNSQIDGKHPQPSIIFLDINMPRMNGWEFLNEYKKLEEHKKGKVVLIMLTTSLNPDDREKALQDQHVKDFMNKFLNMEMLTKIIQENFPEVI